MAATPEIAAFEKEWLVALAPLKLEDHSGAAAFLRSLLRTNLLRYTDVHDRPEIWFHAHRLVARVSGPVGSAFWVRFMVQYNLFAGTVAAAGTDEQLAELEAHRAQGLLGIFGLTEKLAGVSSGYVVNTTATWDDETQEYVLHCADEGARKNWISQGLTADKAVVIADLRINGKSHGPHGFLIDMRDVQGELLPNIKVGDMGPKAFGNDLDNAWIAFSEFRIPAKALLSRHAEVRPGGGGAYMRKLPIDGPMAMIGQRLFTGRLLVAEYALEVAAMLFAFTREYSDGKQCWGPKGNVPLSSIPQLASVYEHAERKFARINAMVSECKRLLCVLLPKNQMPETALQDAIACSKIVACEISIDLCCRLQQEVGAHAIFLHSHFAGVASALQGSKFAEGDTRILMQKLARDRLKTTEAKGSEREQEIVRLLIGKLMKGGMKAWATNSDLVYELAWLVVTRTVDDHAPGTSLGVPFILCKM